MNNHSVESDGQVSFAPATGATKPTRAKRVGKAKTEILRKLLSGPTGATVAQIHKHLAWQPHTIRAAVSGLRSSGLTIDLDRSGRVARYRALVGEVGQ